MIILTRLGGHELAVNPDLIERAEPTPDTVLTMIDGHKIIVVEPVEEVVARVRRWRATVAADAFAISRSADGAAGPSHHPSLYESRAQSTRERSEDDEEALGAHVALQTSLARVLRMPQRGE